MVTKTLTILGIVAMLSVIILAGFVIYRRNKNIFILFLTVILFFVVGFVFSNSFAKTFGLESEVQNAVGSFSLKEEQKNKKDEGKELEKKKEIFIEKGKETVQAGKDLIKEGSEVAMKKGQDIINEASSKSESFIDKTKEVLAEKANEAGEFINNVKETISEEIEESKKMILSFFANKKKFTSIEDFVRYISSNINFTSEIKNVTKFVFLPQHSNIVEKIVKHCSFSDDNFENSVKEACETVKRSFQQENFKIYFSINRSTNDSIDVDFCIVNLEIKDIDSSNYILSGYRYKIFKDHNKQSVNNEFKSRFSLRVTGSEIDNLSTFGNSSLSEFSKSFLYEIESHVNKDLEPLKNRKSPRIEEFLSIIKSKYKEAVEKNISDRILYALNCINEEYVNKKDYALKINIIEKNIDKNYCTFDLAVVYNYPNNQYYRVIAFRTILYEKDNNISHHLIQSLEAEKRKIILSRSKKNDSLLGFTKGIYDEYKNKKQALLNSTKEIEIFDVVKKLVRILNSKVEITKGNLNHFIEQFENGRFSNKIDLKVVKNNADNKFYVALIYYKDNKLRIQSCSFMLDKNQKISDFSLNSPEDLI